MCKYTQLLHATSKNQSDVWTSVFKCQRTGNDGSHDTTRDEVGRGWTAETYLQECWRTHSPGNHQAINQGGNSL